MYRLSKTAKAFYSDISAAGVTRLKLATMTWERDGAAFSMPRLWTEGGRTNGAISAERLWPSLHRGRFGIDGAEFTAAPDPETNFKLFGGCSAAAAVETTARLRLRLRPNRISRRAEAFCRERGIISAKLHGGSAAHRRRLRCASSSRSRRVGSASGVSQLCRRALSRAGIARRISAASPKALSAATIRY